MQLHPHRVTQADLDAFRVGCEAIYNTYMERNFSNLDRGIFEYTIGGRYARLVRTEHGQGRSVHCFVDLTNGNVLKGSWKAPVRNGARGNLYDATQGLGCMDRFGCKYLR